MRGSRCRRIAGSGCVARSGRCRRLRNAWRLTSARGRLRCRSVGAAGARIGRTNGPPAWRIGRSAASGRSPSGWPTRPAKLLRRAWRVGHVRSRRRVDQGVGNSRRSELGSPRVTGSGPWQIVTRGKGSAAAHAGDVREAGEASLVEQLAAVSKAPGYRAALGRRPAGEEEHPDVARCLADTPTRVVTGQLVIGDELLAHVLQHAGQLRRVLGHRHGHLGHALQDVDVGQRHQARHGANHAVDQTELDVGVEGDRLGERASHLIAKSGYESGFHPLLECVQGVTEGFGEVGE